MVDKGWLRIVEAFIAITLILSVFSVMYFKGHSKNSIAEDFDKKMGVILDEVSASFDLREEVLNNNEKAINDFVATRFASGWKISARICNLNELCSLQEYHQEVYSKERLISSTLQKYAPKKLKLFVWQE